MAHRGLYGQAEGNERRTEAATYAEALADNEVVEGHIVTELRRLWRAKRFAAFQAVTERLRAEGHSEGRVASMVTRATVGRVPSR